MPAGINRDDIDGDPLEPLEMADGIPRFSPHLFASGSKGYEKQLDDV